ncbi:MAG: carbohydrate ABC transporter permease [Chloroflexi bacterium]|nr:carbohydrate ABC transporter permease [Chloroflexota bacterium]
MRRRRRGLLAHTLLVRLPLLVFGAWTVFPMYWMLRTSLMSDALNQQVPLRYFPWPITLHYYADAVRGLSLGRLFLNSLIVSGGSGVLALALALLAAYALARYRFRLKAAILLGLAGTQMLPAVFVIVPIFVLFTQLRLANTLAGLLLAESFFAVPFSVLLLKQFYEQIPTELDEAAMVDGCGRLGAIVRVVMPLTLPGVVAVAIFNFINSWNALMLPIVLISSPERMTLPPGLLTLKDQYIFSWATHATGAMIAIVPSLILFTVIQKYLIGGLSAGSVKG